MSWGTGGEETSSDEDEDLTSSEVTYGGFDANEKVSSPHRREDPPIT